MARRRQEGNISAYFASESKMAWKEGYLKGLADDSVRR